MSAMVPDYHQQVLDELDQIPAEFLPAFVKLVRAFREGVLLPNAADSFAQGWHEAMSEQTQPIAQLWDGLDAE
ncbi:MAG: hypothetical protein AAF752_08270 [Bacteroidota bacterium]